MPSRTRCCATSGSHGPTPTSASVCAPRCGARTTRGAASPSGPRPRPGSRSAVRSCRRRSSSCSTTAPSTASWSTGRTASCGGCACCSPPRCWRPTTSSPPSTTPSTRSARASATATSSSTTSSLRCSSPSSKRSRPAGSTPPTTSRRSSARTGLDVADDVVEAFRWYARAIGTGNPVERARCVLAGNVLAVAHEQQRLQDDIAASMDAGPVSIAKLFERPRHGRRVDGSGTGTGLLRRAVAHVANNAWDEIITELMMTLRVPGARLRLDHDIPRRRRRGALPDRSRRPRARRSTRAGRPPSTVAGTARAARAGTTPRATGSSCGRA